MLPRSDNLPIGDHCFNNDHHFKISNYNIIDSTALLLNSRILESIDINSNNSEIKYYQTTTAVYMLDIT